MTNLWIENTPDKFWRITEEIPLKIWEEAVQAALPVLEIQEIPVGAPVEQILEATLGERQFGEDHWRLSTAKRLYYFIKPLLPRPLTRLMRQHYSGKTRGDFRLGWPLEERYVRFLSETLRQVMLLTNRETIQFIHFWPQDYRSALVLTHDIELAGGQALARRLAEMEADYGFHSSFNFVPQRYPLDRSLMDWLRKNGFEIGVHGLKHDGKLFLERKEFSRRAAKINAAMRDFGAVGFRAPLTHRQPEWMQELEMEYDLSFFDTDPYEPIPGGTMTIWPYMLGHFVELPYTLVQDFSLLNLLGEKTDRIWQEKSAYIQEHHGMALINSHPDYLIRTEYWSIYEGFLKSQAERKDTWKALPREAAAWWRARSQARRVKDLPAAKEGRIEKRADSKVLTISI